MTWQKMFTAVSTHVVRIHTQDGFGTGFLCGFNADRGLAAVATAAHVIEQAHDWQQPVRVTHHESGRAAFLSPADRAIFLDRSRDSACIVLATELLPFPEQSLKLMDPARYKVVGTELGWIGFPALAPDALCFFTGRVSAFLKESDSYLVDGVAINGVSGGPVFVELKSEEPQIIGSVSAYLSNRVGGTTLPGLLKAQDISHFAETVRSLPSLKVAREQEKSAAMDSGTTPGS